MDVASTPTTLTIGRLTDAWANNSIRPNPEYQRGSSWRRRQQQLLVDSVLRGYPLPRFYFESKTSKDVLGNAQTSLEVIDGQQRLIALSQFRENQWPLFSVDDEKIPLPPSVRKQTIQWSGKTFSSIPDSMQAEFLAVELSVVLINEVTGDEVRDLFIRLQSGTPLTAQQVRDAWPGNVGPFIERLAGKGTRQGQYHTLFAAVDRRGSGGRSEDEYADPALEGRQTCAQLLLLLIAKERGRGFLSLRSSTLNDLYHENTEFDINGRVARQFDHLLGACQKVLSLRPQRGSRKSVRKSRVFSLFLFLRFLSFSNVSFSRAIEPVSTLFWSDHAADNEPVGRVASADTLEKHFVWFVEQRMSQLSLPDLDKHRLFSEDQKLDIWNKFDGRCGVCGESIDEGMAEYDHTLPWILGGRTVTENGRPVHGGCHARGLAALDAKEAPVVEFGV